MKTEYRVRRKILTENGPTVALALMKFTDIDRAKRYMQEQIDKGEDCHHQIIEVWIEAREVSDWKRIK